MPAKRLFTYLAKFQTASKQERHRQMLATVVNTLSQNVDLLEQVHVLMSSGAFESRLQETDTSKWPKSNIRYQDLSQVVLLWLLKQGCPSLDTAKIKTCCRDNVAILKVLEFGLIISSSDKLCSRLKATMVNMLQTRHAVCGERRLQLKFSDAESKSVDWYACGCFLLDVQAGQVIHCAGKTKALPCGIEVTAQSRVVNNWSQPFAVLHVMDGISLKLETIFAKELEETPALQICDDEVPSSQESSAISNRNLTPIADASLPSSAAASSASGAVQNPPKQIRKLGAVAAPAFKKQKKAE